MSCARTRTKSHEASETVFKFRSCASSTPAAHPALSRPSDDGTVPQRTIYDLGVLVLGEVPKPPLVRGRMLEEACAFVWMWLVIAALYTLAEVPPTHLAEHFDAALHAPVVGATRCLLGTVVVIIICRLGLSTRVVGRICACACVAMLVCGTPLASAQGLAHAPPAGPPHPGIGAEYAWDPIVVGGVAAHKLAGEVVMARGEGRFGLMCARAIVAACRQSWVHITNMGGVHLALAYSAVSGFAALSEGAGATGLGFVVFMSSTVAWSLILAESVTAGFVWALSAPPRAYPAECIAHGITSAITLTAWLVGLIVGAAALVVGRPKNQGAWAVVMGLGCWGFMAAQARGSVTLRSSRPWSRLRVQGRHAGRIVLLICVLIALATLPTARAASAMDAAGLPSDDSGDQQIGFRAWFTLAVEHVLTAEHEAFESITDGWVPAGLWRAVIYGWAVLGAVGAAFLAACLVRVLPLRALLRLVTVVLRLLVRLFRVACVCGFMIFLYWRVGGGYQWDRPNPRAGTEVALWSVEWNALVLVWSYLFVLGFVIAAWYVLLGYAVILVLVLRVVFALLMAIVRVLWRLRILVVTALVCTVWVHWPKPVYVQLASAAAVDLPMPPDDFMPAHTARPSPDLSVVNPDTVGSQSDQAADFSEWFALAVQCVMSEEQDLFQAMTDGWVPSGMWRAVIYVWALMGAVGATFLLGCLFRVLPLGAILRAISLVLSFLARPFRLLCACALAVYTYWAFGGGYQWPVADPTAGTEVVAWSESWNLFVWVWSHMFLLGFVVAIWYASMGYLVILLVVVRAAIATLPAAARVAWRMRMLVAAVLIYLAWPRWPAPECVRLASATSVAAQPHPMPPYTIIRQYARFAPRYGQLNSTHGEITEGDQFGHDDQVQRKGGRSGKKRSQGNKVKHARKGRAELPEEDSEFDEMYEQAQVVEHVAVVAQRTYVSDEKRKADKTKARAARLKRETMALKMAELLTEFRSSGLRPGNDLYKHALRNGIEFRPLLDKTCRLLIRSAQNDVLGHKADLAVQQLVSAMPPNTREVRRILANCGIAINSAMQVIPLESSAALARMERFNRYVTFVRLVIDFCLANFRYNGVTTQSINNAAFDGKFQPAGLVASVSSQPSWFSSSPPSWPGMKSRGVVYPNLQNEVSMEAWESTEAVLGEPIRKFLFSGRKAGTGREDKRTGLLVAASERHASGIVVGGTPGQRKNRNERKKARNFYNKVAAGEAGSPTVSNAAAIAQELHDRRYVRRDMSDSCIPQSKDHRRLYWYDVTLFMYVWASLEFEKMSHIRSTMYAKLAMDSRSKNRKYSRFVAHDEYEEYAPEGGFIDPNYVAIVEDLEPVALEDVVPASQAVPKGSVAQGVVAARYLGLDEIVDGDAVDHNFLGIAFPQFLSQDSQRDLLLASIISFMRQQSEPRSLSIVGRTLRLYAPRGTPLLADIPLGPFITPDAITPGTVLLPTSVHIDTSFYEDLLDGLTDAFGPYEMALRSRASVRDFAPRASTAARHGGSRRPRDSSISSSHGSISETDDHNPPKPDQPVARPAPAEGALRALLSRGARKIRITAVDIDALCLTDLPGLIAMTRTTLRADVYVERRAMGEDEAAGVREAWWAQAANLLRLPRDMIVDPAGNASLLARLVAAVLGEVCNDPRAVVRSTLSANGPTLLDSRGRGPIVAEIDVQTRREAAALISSLPDDTVRALIDETRGRHLETYSNSVVTVLFEAAATRRIAATPRSKRPTTQRSAAAPSHGSASDSDSTPSPDNGAAATQPTRGAAAPAADPPAAAAASGPNPPSGHASPAVHPTTPAARTEAPAPPQKHECPGAKASGAQPAAASPKPTADEPRAPPTWRGKAIPTMSPTHEYDRIRKPRETWVFDEPSVGGKSCCPKLPPVPTASADARPGAGTWAALLFGARRGALPGAPAACPPPAPAPKAAHAPIPRQQAPSDPPAMAVSAPVACPVPASTPEPPQPTSVPARPAQATQRAVPAPKATAPPCDAKRTSVDDRHANSVLADMFSPLRPGAGRDVAERAIAAQRLSRPHEVLVLIEVEYPNHPEHIRGTSFAIASSPRTAACGRAEDCEVVAPEPNPKPCAAPHADLPLRERLQGTKAARAARANVLGGDDAARPATPPAPAPECPPNAPALAPLAPPRCQPDVPAQDSPASPDFGNMGPEHIDYEPATPPAEQVSSDEDAADEGAQEEEARDQDHEANEHDAGDAAGPDGQNAPAGEMGLAPPEQDYDDSFHRFLMWLAFFLRWLYCNSFGHRPEELPQILAQVWNFMPAADDVRRAVASAQDALRRFAAEVAAGIQIAMAVVMLWWLLTRPWEVVLDAWHAVTHGRPRAHGPVSEGRHANSADEQPFIEAPIPDDLDRLAPRSNRMYEVVSSHPTGRMLFNCREAPEGRRLETRLLARSAQWDLVFPWPRCWTLAAGAVACLVACWWYGVRAPEFPYRARVENVIISCCVLFLAIETERKYADFLVFDAIGRIQYGEDWSFLCAVHQVVMCCPWHVARARVERTLVRPIQFEDAEAAAIIDQNPPGVDVRPAAHSRIPLRTGPSFHHYEALVLEVHVITDTRTGRMQYVVDEEAQPCQIAQGSVSLGLVDNNARLSGLADVTTVEALRTYAIAALNGDSTVNISTHHRVLTQSSNVNLLTAMLFHGIKDTSRLHLNELRPLPHLSTERLLGRI